MLRSAIQRGLKPFHQQILLSAFAKATIKLPKVDTYKIKGKVPNKITLTTEEGLSMLRDMMTIRKMETQCDKLYKSALIRGFLHLYDGQEAIAVGHKYATEKKDNFIGAYRIHGWAYTHGFSVYEIIAEMMGKYSGASDGKGGSMHYYKTENGFFGGHGIVGDQVSCAVGLAFAQQYSGDNKHVTFGSYGDGSANQGQVHEGMNLAKLWNLPIVYLLENNNYAMGTSTERHSANTKYYKRYDTVPGVRVDGHNVLTMKAMVDFSKQYALKHGPIMLEAKTYRYHGHSMSDPGLSYRDRQEIVDTRKNKDCINQLKDILLKHKLTDADTIKQIDNETKKEVMDAIKLAQEDGEPPLDQLFVDVTDDPLETYHMRNINYEDSVFKGGKAL